jgi:TPR repeat protein
MELLNQSCTYGEKDSCIIVAGNKLYGIGTAKAPEEGIASYKRACEKDHLAMACTDYARLLVQGTIVPKDLPTGLDILKRACEAKYERIYPRACVILGDVNAAGGPAGKDLAAAAKLYQAACDQGDYIGCTRLAQFMADGIAIPKDPAKALGMLDAGCKVGDAGSCDYLGNWYALGKAGLTPNGAKGIEYLQMACDDPLWSACSNIGAIYLNGVGGVPKDKASATKYLRLACEHGYDEACQTMKKNLL